MTHDSSRSNSQSRVSVCNLKTSPGSQNTKGIMSKSQAGLCDSSLYFRLMVHFLPDFNFSVTQISKQYGINDSPFSIVVRTIKGLTLHHGMSQCQPQGGFLEAC